MKMQAKCEQKRKRSKIKKIYKDEEEVEKNHYLIDTNKLCNILGV